MVCQVGFGNIGRHVARRLSGYDCEILYFDTDEMTLGRDGELGAKCKIEEHKQFFPECAQTISHHCLNLLECL